MSSSSRTCVGCRVSGDPQDFVRVVLGPEGQIVPDLAGGAFGRGAWLHPRAACVEGAARGGLGRSFKAEVRASASEIRALIQRAARRRTLSLLSSAQRSGQAGLGTTALEEAEREGRVLLLVLAEDARASAELSSVARLSSRGRVVTFGTKSELGQVFGREELALIAVFSPGLSREISRMVSVSELEGPETHRVTEVG